MEEKILEIIFNSSSDQYLALRNKISELNDVSFKDFIVTLDSPIELGGEEL
ncbi:MULTISPECIES: hypothetical protein [Paenibacillus]|uniref:Uncharacterized protein n=1 Tax=Paenibacillus peoriae TaxID=59893 RepID=A0ABU1QAP0_9BACL|nr:MULTISPECIES: hypothetical protein [Paenibacillus]MDR6776250.1 hypothetical protein [Paenibacillus peoriae]